MHVAFSNPKNNGRIVSKCVFEHSHKLRIQFKVTPLKCQSIALRRGSTLIETIVCGLVSAVSTSIVGQYCRQALHAFCKAASDASAWMFDFC